MSKNGIELWPKPKTFFEPDKLQADFLEPVPSLQWRLVALLVGDAAEQSNNKTGEKSFAGRLHLSVTSQERHQITWWVFFPKKVKDDLTWVGDEQGLVSVQQWRRRNRPKSCRCLCHGLLLNSCCLLGVHDCSQAWDRAWAWLAMTHQPCVRPEVGRQAEMHGSDVSKSKKLPSSLADSSSSTWESSLRAELGGDGWARHQVRVESRQKTAFGSRQALTRLNSLTSLMHSALQNLSFLGWVCFA